MEQLWVNPSPWTSAKYAQLVAADGAVARYRMNDSGLVLRDDIGGFHGTLAGGISEGQVGAIYGDPDRAIAFDGKNGKADVPWAAALNPAPAFSVEAWFKKPVQQLVNNPIWDCRPASSGANAAGFDLFLNVGSGVGLSVCSTNVAQTLITAPAVKVGVYFHAVATYDGARARLYINGVLLAGPTACPYTPNPSAIAGIAHLANGGGNFATATLDELAIYPTALTDAQIAAHFAAGSTQRFGASLNQDQVRVASELAPSVSPAPAGNAYVPAGWVLQMGDEGEWDTMLTVNGQPRANFTQTTVPYYSGGWPPDPLTGTPGHTPPTR